MNYFLYTALPLLLVGLSFSSSEELQTRLIGGKGSTPGQFPYIVSLQKLDNTTGNYSHFCAGSIANTKQIVTAAHCVVDIGMTADPTPFRIVAGAYDITKAEATQQIIAVLNATAHPKYDKDLAASGNDIGVITLVSELVFNAAVQAIALNNNKTNAASNCVNTGWGNTFPVSALLIKISPTLQQLPTKLVPDAYCMAAYFYNIMSFQGTVCSKVNGILPISTGKGTCQGDSGGPLACNGSDGKPYLVGAVSWGFNFCGSGLFPDVHASISKLMDFLESVLISHQ